MTYILTVTAPCAWLRTNQRHHFHQRADLTRQWREAAAWQARKARLPSLGLGPVTVTATIHRSDKRSYDLDGAVPTVKACIDGLRDADVLWDDDCRVIPELTIRHGEPWADAALVLTIDTYREKASA